MHKYEVSHADGTTVTVDSSELEQTIFDMLTGHDPDECRVVELGSGVAYRVTFD